MMHKKVPFGNSLGADLNNPESLAKPESAWDFGLPWLAA
jgi:hypothetical protein